MTKKQKAPVFKFAMLCDDVRREDNGKMILIGIYGSDMILQSASTIMLNMVVWMDMPESRVYDLNVEILVDNVTQNTGRLSLHLPEGKNNMGSFPVPLNITKTCMVDIKLSEGQGAPKKLVSMPIRVG